MRALSILLLCSALVSPAADKKPSARAANGKVEVSATLYADPESVREQLGSDLGGSFFVVKVELTPAGGQPLTINRDDFVLRSYKNGQKCQPYAPSQIAGSGALVLSPRGAAPVVATNPGDKEDPVLAVLKSKILPEQRTSERVSGLLYFSLEGKYKPKDLVLQYKSPAGELTLAFR
jgi:hypothetical protein